MQMRVTLGGFGLAVPTTRLGVNVASGAYIDFRGDIREEPYRLLLGNVMTVDGNSGTVVASQVWTTWFAVNVSAHPWLHRKNTLVGKRAELTCSGTYAGSGEVELRFDVFDAYHEPKTFLRTAFIESTGFQINATSIRGRLERWYTDEEKDHNVHLRMQ